MEMMLFTEDVHEYLKCDELIDFDQPAVRSLAARLYDESENETDFIRRAYEYVRDRIAHSADIGADEVTCSASEVLKAGHGICFAKSHLLAAILRSQAVPAGFCYQKLILDDETAPVLITHGLNGVYLRETGKWIRLDARGNKPGVNARFSTDCEHLAFPIRPEKGETDSFVIYAEPDTEVVRALKSHDSRAEFWDHLPMRLGYETTGPDTQIRKSISDTRRGFEESFAEGYFYNRQTQDSGHLERILRFVNIREGMKILDLGTGSGYLSFPIAKRHPGCEVVGLDIVSAALEANRKRADAEGIRNLSFVRYDGIDFPFEAETFDLVVTRYVLHHFPDIGHGIEEVSRVLKSGGALFISDPRPNECDQDRFVDDYMRLKKDGHIRFYTREEWTGICAGHGLVLRRRFDSSIRFPRKKEASPGYEKVLEKHPGTVLESYDLEETETELYLTEQVNNLLFEKG